MDEKQWEEYQFWLNIIKRMRAEEMIVAALELKQRFGIPNEEIATMVSILKAATNSI